MRPQDQEDADPAPAIEHGEMVSRLTHGARPVARAPTRAFRAARSAHRAAAACEGRPHQLAERQDASTEAHPGNQDREHRYRKRSEAEPEGRPRAARREDDRIHHGLADKEQDEHRQRRPANVERHRSEPGSALDQRAPERARRDMKDHADMALLPTGALVGGTLHMDREDARHERSRTEQRRRAGGSEIEAEAQILDDVS